MRAFSVNGAPPRQRATGVTARCPLQRSPTSPRVTSPALGNRRCGSVASPSNRHRWALRMRKPTFHRDNPKSRRVVPQPADVDVALVAAKCRYVGSPYHAAGPTAGRPATRRPDAAICPEELTSDRRRVEEWLRAGVVAGRTGAWEGGFPRYVWHRQEETVYEARQGAPGSGEYHGYPLQPRQRVRGFR